MKRFGGKQFYIKYEKMAMPLLIYKIIIEMKLRSNKMKKVIMIMGLSFMFSGCFSTTLIECKKPVVVNGTTFCEK